MIKDSITDIRKSLRKDKEYYYGWQANIAMAFKDATYLYKKKHKKQNLSEKDIHIIANEAAMNFLNLLMKPSKEEKRNDKIEDILS